MQAGTERERLLRVAGGLDRELGFEGGQSESGFAGQAGKSRFAELLSDEDEQLVRAIREALLRLASAVSGAAVDDGEVKRRATLAALDGAEMVICTEILAGRDERVAEILPGAVYLVALPAVGKAEGLRLSRRTEELLAA